jgi:hypothetical protein
VNERDQERWKEKERCELESMYVNLHSKVLGYLGLETYKVVVKYF